MDRLSALRAQEYKVIYDQFIDAATRLDRLRRLENGGGVDAHATAAMHAARFAATILWPATTGAPPPDFRDGSDRLLHLAGVWREAALEAGEFAPERPALRLIACTEPGDRPAAGGGQSAGPTGSR